MLSHDVGVLQKLIPNVRVQAYDLQRTVDLAVPVLAMVQDAVNEVVCVIAVAN